MLNLSVQNLVLKYPRKTVLNGVSVDFNHSQIHALIGENGAGKSSLIKIICGDILPTSGKIFVNQKDAEIKTPADAIKHGIVCVHQRPLLADSISIIENLMLGAAKFDRKRAEELLKIWLPDMDEKTLIKNCSGDIRFFTSLTGALLKNPELLILDEPSALLDGKQRDFLFEKLKAFSSEGMNIIVITHFMDEAKKYGDTITCLEEGVVSKPKADFLNAAITESNSHIENASLREQHDFYLSFNDLTSIPNDKPAIRDFTFTARSSEITLISGQAEDGRETLEDTISGMSSAKQKGELKITDKINLREFTFVIKDGNFTRRQLEKSPFTFGIIPSNKTFRGSNPNLTILQLLSAGVSENREYAQRLIKKANVNITLNEKAEVLSGGMLQRLILERELSKNPDILILCEPVQGLDSASVKKLCDRIRLLANSGKIVLVLSSSEFPEEICDKIYRLGRQDLKGQVHDRL
ncbi:MAG: ATP-binding cassette domain-containing protein [Treponema sp.]|nr:ATP-binding cassette domain-containing protein [Treponema sp.]